MTVTALIAQYGYWAVFIGAMLEGETVLLLAGFAAHRGLLRLPEVMLLAFVASTLGDQMFYWLGRRYGAQLFARFPSLAARVPKVRGLLDKYHAPLILSMRFWYGLRMASPIVMGALHVSAIRFSVLNAVGAAVWAMLIGWIGYQFGNLLELIFQDIRRIEELVLVVILVAGLGWWWFQFLRAKNNRP